MNQEKDQIVTSDFSRFGARERKLARELLEAWETQGLPPGFYDSKVSIMNNSQSGTVFLSNEDYQAALMNGDKLELFHSCGYCGHEGFKEDFKHTPHDQSCIEVMLILGVLTVAEAAAYTLEVEA